MKFSTLILATLLSAGLVTSCNNSEETIYDEADVPRYTLPEVLVTEKGDSVKNFQAWNRVRRPEILALFSSEMYGPFPDTEYSIDFTEKVLTDHYLDSTAIVKEITGIVQTDAGSEQFTILYVFPRNMKRIPVFTGLNFSGNHTIDTLPAISIHNRWVRNSEKAHISDNHASPDSRGTSASRWPLADIISKGYGVATAYYGEFDPDYDDDFQNGFHPLFAAPGNGSSEYCPGAISMWAKGMSFIADYLVQDTVADPSRIIAIGHSRLGKTALWAGANDTRFSAVISNNSGCGGAALSRRRFGEKVSRINTTFPHWFCDRFNRYNDKENRLPMDQHMLLALMAPRPLYVASAAKDRWADPHGEFLALQAAAPVYGIFGYDQDFPQELPDPDRPYHGITGYHLRSGVHDITRFDWMMYMNWCDHWLPQ
jgi:hypothetical protein